jgi:hypothetical protein
VADVKMTLRTDPALQRAFGREACDEQSTVHVTLDACTDPIARAVAEALTVLLAAEHIRVRLGEI